MSDTENENNEKASVELAEAAVTSESKEASVEKEAVEKVPVEKEAVEEVPAAVEEAPAAAVVDVDVDAEKASLKKAAGEADDGGEELDWMHLKKGWLFLNVLLKLFCWGFSIYFAVYYIQQFINQPEVFKVDVVNFKKTPINFPAIQFCPVSSFRPIIMEGIWHLPKKLAQANFTPSDDKNLLNSSYWATTNWTAMPSPLINYTLPPNAETQTDYDYEGGDYDYDTPGKVCYEFNNDLMNGIKTRSKKDRLFFIISVGKPELETDNYTCTLDDVIDAWLPGCDAENKTLTITSVDTAEDALGITASFFTQDTKKQNITRVRQPTELISAGARTKIRSTLSVQSKFGQQVSRYQEQENTWTATISTLKYPSADGGLVFDTNYDVANGPFDVPRTVYIEVSFATMLVSNVTIEKPYTPFNAFGDGTAVMGFFTGFGLWGVPTVADFTWEGMAGKFRKTFF